MEGWYRKQGYKKPRDITTETKELGAEDPETEMEYIWDKLAKTEKKTGEVNNRQGNNYKKDLIHRTSLQKEPMKEIQK